MNWYIAVFNNYFKFSGRARRKEYWWFNLFNFFATIILIGLDVVLGSISINENTTTGFLSGIYSITVLIPSIAVTIRRLHDTNRSGWWLLINLIPIVGTIAFFVFLVQKGTSGDNRYGSDPKQNEQTIPA